MELTRFSNKGGTVLGILLHGKSVYFTLEPSDNLLPIGIYSVGEYSSRKNGNCLMVWNCDIPKSRGFEMHIGNSRKNTAGCILVGNSCDLAKRTIGNSRKAMAQLMADHDDRLTIIDWSN